MPENIKSINERLIWVGENFGRIADSYSNYFELGIPVVYGLLIFTFFSKRLNLAESFVFGLYTCAFAIELPSVLLFWASGNWAMLISFILLSLISGYAVNSIGSKRGFWKYIGGTAVGMLSVVLYMFLFAGVMYLVHPFIV